MKSIKAWFQRTQLHRARADGDALRVRELVARHYPLNRFDEMGNTPLHYAVGGEHCDVAEFLLRSGANVNAHDERVVGNTPLAEVAGRCSLRLAQLLVQAGADPNVPGWMQLTALDRARARTDAEGEKVFKLLEEAAHGLRPPARGRTEAAAFVRGITNGR